MEGQSCIHSSLLPHRLRMRHKSLAILFLKVACRSENALGLSVMAPCRHEQWGLEGARSSSRSGPTQ